MAYENQDIVVFQDITSTGIDKIPLGSVVLIKSTGNMYYYLDNSGVTSSTQVGTLSMDIVATLYGASATPSTPSTLFTKALFYGGQNISGVPVSTTTLLSSTADLVQAETSVGTARYAQSGANVGTNALFYGGWGYSGIGPIVTLLSPTADLVQAETSVGTARYYLAGANVGTNALFYGGNTSNKATLLSSTAVLVQAETSVGTARSDLEGASV
jgi:hypothetical protein